LFSIEIFQQLFSVVDSMFVSWIGCIELGHFFFIPITTIESDRIFMWPACLNIVLTEPAWHQDISMACSYTSLVWVSVLCFPPLKVKYILGGGTVLLPLVSHQEEKALCTFLVLICVWNFYTYCICFWHHLKLGNFSIAPLHVILHFCF
jgi:hypothetical protein